MEVHMPRFHLKDANNMKDQTSIFSKTGSLIEMFVNENYLDELQEQYLKEQS